jgi:hypothetical protein
MKTVAHLILHFFVFISRSVLKPRRWDDPLYLMIIKAVYVQLFFSNLIVTIGDRITSEKATGRYKNWRALWFFDGGLIWVKLTWSDADFLVRSVLKPRVHFLGCSSSSSSIFFRLPSWISSFFVFIFWSDGGKCFFLGEEGLDLYRLEAAGGGGRGVGGSGSVTSTGWHM